MLFQLNPSYNGINPLTWMKSASQVKSPMADKTRILFHRSHKALISSKLIRISSCQARFHLSSNLTILLYHCFLLIIIYTYYLITTKLISYYTLPIYLTIIKNSLAKFTIKCYNVIVIDNIYTFK